MSLFELAVGILVFFLGTSFASFVNVVAGGTGDIKKNLSRRHSTCESCKKTLRWWELIPVASWLFLKGQCNRCSSPIPLLHPLSGIALGLMFFVTTAIMLGDPLTIAVTLLVVFVMYFFSVYDVLHGIVPDRFVFPVILVVLGIRIVEAVIAVDYSPLLNYLATAAMYFLFFALINTISRLGLFPGVKKGKEGFGWGDAKYGLFLGLILGWPLGCIALWVAVFAGGFVGIIVLLIYRQRNATMAFIPFMSFGAWVALLWGADIMIMVRRFIMY